MKTYYAKAPLRIGLAGGGTDVSPYADLYGGAILNATINLHAYATIKPTEDGLVHFVAQDNNAPSSAISATKTLPLDGDFTLFKGIYNRIVSQFAKRPLAFELTTYVD